MSSLFLTSPTTHTHAQSAAAAAPRNLGEGLWVRDTAAGTGASAAGATVAVLYTCRLHATNKRVDHRSNPNSPFTFILGRGAVVEGLDRGLEGMAVGGERELVVPAHLGGTAGAPPKIPPDAALHFAIKLLRVGDGEDAAKGGKRRRARARRARRRPRGYDGPLIGRLLLARRGFAVRSVENLARTVRINKASRRTVFRERDKVVKIILARPRVT